jgi:hypothetical protein
MKLKITASDFATKRYLEVNSEGVKFCESSFLGGVRRFGFKEIECILMSPENVLSFQVGQEVFSIPTKPEKEKHKQVIDTLLNEVRRSANPAGQGNM